MNARAFLRRDGVVLAVYILLALALTYPLLLHLDTHAPGRGVDDPALLWVVWWFKYSIFNLNASPLYSDYIFYPLGINLVSFTSTFLNGLLSLPLQFSANVIFANNLVMYFVLVSGGYGTFLLAREILIRQNIHSDFAAALAGAFYAFGAWHIHYVGSGDFNLPSNEWIPFFVLYLIRFDKARWHGGALAGLFVVLTAWTELTFVPFLAIVAVLMLPYLLLTRRDAWKNILSNTFALGVVTTLGISPIAINLLSDFARYGYYLTQGLGRVQIFSAEPISFIIPSFEHPVLGEWGNAITQAQTTYAFVGIAALILAALGAHAYRTHAIVRFWSVVAIFFALVMLGPTLIIAGQNTNILMPFALLRAIPFVNANRYPVRFNVMLMLALTPLIAFGVVSLRARRNILIPLLLLLAFEQLVAPIPIADSRVPAIFETIRAEAGDFSVLDLPLGWRNSIAFQGKLDYQAQFLQTVHQKRSIGGQTSRNPAYKFQYFLQAPVINSLVALENNRELDAAQRERDRTLAPAVVHFFNIRYVEAHRALTSPEVLDYARDIFSLKEIYHDDTRIVYRVALTPARWQTLDPGDEIARLNFDDSWGRPNYRRNSNDTNYRWATRSDARIWLPLERRDQTIILRMRGAHPRQDVTIQLNGLVITKIVLEDAWNDYAVHVPAGHVRENLNEFVFVTDTVRLDAVRWDDYAIGATGVVSPVDIAVTGAGYDAGRFGEIIIAGKNVIENKRGYQLVALQPQTGNVERVASFDTLADPNESSRLAQFVAQLPPGEIVAGVAIDDVSGKLQLAAIDALNSLGVESDLRFQFRAGHAFIGVKGAVPGQAVERIDGRLPANVAVGKNVSRDHVAFALGTIQVETTGK